MAKYPTNSLGYKLVFNGPGTVEEFDQKAGKVGACLEGAIDDELFRGTLPEWQDKFGAHLVSLFGERQENESATAAAQARADATAAKKGVTAKKVNPVMETWTRYHNRVTATLDDAARKELAAKAQEIADAVEIDPSPSARAGRISKEYREKAQAILAGDVDSIEAKLTDWANKYPNVDVTSIERGEDGKPSEEDLAKLIRSIMDSLKSEL